MSENEIIFIFILNKRRMKGTPGLRLEPTKFTIFVKKN